MTNLTYICLGCEKVNWETEKCTVYGSPEKQTRFVDNPKIGVGCHFAWEIIEKAKAPVKIKRRVGQQKQKKRG